MTDRAWKLGHVLAAVVCVGDAAYLAARGQQGVAFLIAIVGAWYAAKVFR